ncbi:MAG: hypothetical protein K6T94_21820 [Paenibacillus sp.]|nr:hypothetical protein [Paenibacillus sp.]
MIIKNPALAVKRSKADKKEMLYWSEEESHKFLQVATSDRYYYAFLLTEFTDQKYTCEDTKSRLHWVGSSKFFPCNGFNALFSSSDRSDASVMTDSSTPRAKSFLATSFLPQASS